MEDRQFDLPYGLNIHAGYISLPVTLEPWPKAGTIYVDGETLLLKKEFHVSILSVKRYAPFLAKKTGQSVEEAFAELAKETGSYLRLSSMPFGLDKIRDEFRIASEEPKKSALVMCDVVGIERLFDFVRQRFKLEIPTQPTHVTLYTRNDGKGIGLVNDEEMAVLSRPATAEEATVLRQAIDLDNLSW